MKNYLIKSILVSLTLIWSLAISSSLYAISFNESRKVIVSNYSNAVYRDLTVLDTMRLGTAEEGKIFLLEVGKRPTYFWDVNKRFYLYQSQTLEFQNIQYNNVLNQTLYINDMFANGTFISEGVTFNKRSNITINKTGNLLLSYHGARSMTFSDMPRIVLVRSFNVSNFNPSTDPPTSSNVNLYLRDLKVGTKAFPNPRLFLYSSGSYVRARGTVTDFKLQPINGTSLKNYYGNWTAYPSATSNLKTIDDSADACGDRPFRCYKHNNINNTNISYDNDTTFSCVGKKDPPGNGIHDPAQYEYNGAVQDYCYDYNSYTIINDMVYNNNRASYEFKVQEIYALVPSGSGLTATLIEQNPKVFNGGATPFFVLNGANLNNLNNAITTSQNILINGTNYSFNPSSMQTVAASESNPCYTICNEKQCTSNMVYVRSGFNFQDVSLSGGSQSTSVTNLWPDAEGPKQHLVIRTFTVGFCPALSTSKSYETNYTNSTANYEGLYPSNKRYKMCVRRKVKCNRFTSESETQSEGNFTLLSTDY